MLTDDEYSEIVVLPDGSLVTVYSDLCGSLYCEIGSTEIKRASRVEPSEVGSTWTVDMGPVGGRIYDRHPETAELFSTRAEAIAFEIQQLQALLPQLRL